MIISAVGNSLFVICLKICYYFKRIIYQDCYNLEQFSRLSTGSPTENIYNKKVGEAVVELDQFKSILATYTEPLVEVRDSL